MRRVYRTPLGDPAVLNVCKVVDTTDLSRLGLKLIPPDSTLGASCAAEFSGARVKDQQSVVISVLRSGPEVSPTPRRTVVSGQTVYAFPYDSGSCLRQLVMTAGGATTTVSVRLYGALPGGRAQSCGVSDALIAPFAAIAAGKTTPPTVPTASPSLFALDACQVGAAARISSSPLAAGSTATGTSYDTSCSWAGSGSLFVSTGLLRNPSATPDGKAVTVGKHTLYNTTTVKNTCNYTSKQSGGETLELYYSPKKPATAAQCGKAAALLGRYLDVLGLR